MKSLSRSKVFWLGLAVLAAGVIWFRYNSSEGVISGKRYGKIKRGDIVQRVTVAGQIRPLRRTAFVAPNAGYILKIYVRVGQIIRENDPIVSIKSSLQSPEPVYPLRAPFAGVVVDVAKMEGEYVSATDAKDIIVRVDDSSKYFVYARAPELDASRIKKGMEVEVRVGAIDSGNALKGIVRDIDLAAQDADGWKSQQSTFNVRVEILDPPEGLRSGQSAILEHEFINQEGDKHFVTTKTGKHKSIEVGRQSDTAMEIKSGVNEGEEVEQIDFLKLLESGT